MRKVGGQSGKLSSFWPSRPFASSPLRVPPAPAPAPYTVPVAANDDAPAVFDAMLPADVGRMLEAMSLEGKEIGDDAIGVTVGGVKMILFLRPGSLQLYAAFAATPATDLARLNEWNRAVRYAKAYLDGEGNAVLEADFPLHGGVTEEAVREWVSIYVACLQRFVTDLLNAPADAEEDDEYPMPPLDGPLN